MGPRWSRLVGHFKGDTFSTHSIFLLLGQDRSADKLRFVERDEESHSGLKWSRLFVEFMAIEGIAHLGPKGIPGAQPGRLQTVSVANSQDVIPDRLDRSGVGNDFESI